MTLRTDILAGLPGDLFTLLGTSFNVKANDIYFDEKTRWRRSPTEILLTWGGRKKDSDQVGRLITSAINIQLYLATPDSVVDKSRRFEDKIEAAARTIVETYDNNESRIAGLTSCIVDAVQCFEKTSIDVVAGGPAEPYERYVQNIALEITAWES